MDECLETSLNFNKDEWEISQTLLQRNAPALLPHERVSHGARLQDQSLTKE